MNASLTPVERTAASEALRHKDKRIAALERKALTCPSCGCLLVCPMCGADPGAKPADEPLERRFVGPGEVDDNSGGGHETDPLPF
jgi:hypothetical protein